MYAYLYKFIVVAAACVTVYGTDVRTCIPTHATGDAAGVAAATAVRRADTQVHQKWFDEMSVGRNEFGRDERRTKRASDETSRTKRARTKRARAKRVGRNELGRIELVSMEYIRECVSEYVKQGVKLLRRKTKEQKTKKRNGGRSNVNKTTDKNNHEQG